MARREHSFTILFSSVDEAASVEVRANIVSSRVDSCRCSGLALMLCCMGNLDLERVWHSVVRLAFRRDYVGSIPTARSNSLVTYRSAPLDEVPIEVVTRHW